jgi:hypothetical protein
VQAEQIINTARLREQLGRAEFRVELRTENLGPLAVHTVVRDGEVGVAIRVQSSEAQALLTSELPGLKRALADQNLRVENIVVGQGSLSNGTAGGGSHSQFEDFPRPAAHFTPWTAPPITEPAVDLPAEMVEVAGQRRRLSVHA